MQNNNIFQNIRWLTIICLVLVACSANNDQLVALWTLDEITEQKAKDSSKNEAHGTCIGNPEVDVNEGINGALKFDGKQDYIKVEKEDLFDLTHAITVAAWIKVNEFNKNWQAIVTKGDNSQATDRFWDGWIDEVRIYSRPLTANEIAELYARHKD
jgi:hypothetical protein